ncbi:MAG: hypothetical protein ACFCUE_15555 [Candidatus Bathyarchaeia archaeon]
MTKELKCHLEENLDDAQITVTPQLVDNTLHLCVPSCIHEIDQVVVEPKKLEMVKPKMTTIKTELETITSQLYDLECGVKPAKVLDIDLDLYQMEDY